MQIPGAKEAYEPVAQVLALHQNENRNDQHDDGGLERSQDRLDNGPSHREHRGLRRGELDDERLLLRAAQEEPPDRCCPRRGRTAGTAAGAVAGLPPLEESRDGREACGGESLDSLHLVLDGLDIVRDIGRQGGGLTPEQRANQTDGSQRDKHTQRDRGGPPQSDPPKDIDQRREDE